MSVPTRSATCSISQAFQAMLPEDYLSSNVLFAYKCPQPRTLPVQKATSYCLWIYKNPQPFTNDILHYVPMEMERDLSLCLELKRCTGLLLWKCFAFFVNANYMKTKTRLKKHKGIFCTEIFQRDILAVPLR